MRSAKIVLCILSFAGVCTLTPRVSAQPPVQRRIVIAASTVLDGKGRVLRNTRIVIEGSKIVALEPINDPKADAIHYDLRGLTVLPGWIDAHVHINWFFGKDGKLAGGDAPADEAAFAAASNAWVTLMAGFTTVQNMSSPTTMRDAIARAPSRVRAS